MLMEIHLFLTAITFILLIIGLTNKTKRNKQGQDLEVRGNIPLLLSAAFIFFFLSYTSLDIDYYTCHNQITWMNGTAQNDTQVTNQITCQNQIIKDTPLSSLNLGMGILSALLSIFFAINLLRENVE